MDKSKMTAEQKLYFFYGYLYCKSQEFSEQFPRYTVNESMEMFINELKVKNSK
jgi:hypothetical protein